MSRAWEVGLLKKFNRIRESHLQVLLPKYQHLLKWKSNEAVLDVGCGAGDLSKKFIYPLIPKDFSRFVCSDKSSAMLQHAKKEFEGQSRIFFEELDITADLSKEKMNNFDHIFSFWCLMWISNQTKAFQNMYDLMAPGGGSFHFLPDRHNFINTIEGMLGKPRWKKFVPDVDQMYPFPYRKVADPVKTIKDMMKDIGYVNVEVFLEPTKFAFNSKEEFLGFSKAIPNPLNLMTTEEQKDFQEEFVELAYANKTIHESGECEDAGRVLIIYGEK